MSKKPQPQKTGQIRIIGGQWRGRKLPVPDSPGLRPTTDRVRETLFNWLAPVLNEARCLDCFAGSGALGFEALSRYAGKTVLLESERSIAQQLQQNLQRLNSDKGQVVHTNALQWLAQAGTPFDVVFLDPPFRRNLLTETFTLLEQQGWLADEAWIYVEAETEHAVSDAPANWHLHREKTAGQVAYRLYVRRASSLNETAGNEE
ncbi:16S rRNA (guanine(966)-N(2))-methyltransferase [Budviciaceae bacterium BWR-B9]|uniref:Ribosomal RNA small subunit methyltransferase D n=1 Tax=Limnobaculum allomyrinae TaxID=2791986 RepID=A0ABS1IRV7_9GAMM|nr:MULTISPECIES: 16S rRNA (guanine(966)-N(2))-methyltransferase [Limnobaculum]MBK5144040.1 16S rRNA (guanine(966)-N(2))-methyltransferase [Limnobaculum allomyrinae]MBV7691699.1 16S rRNA (guanine(966)-N(2))-methyltransferase [Limnobaculum sp. M2-1]